MPTPAPTFPIAPFQPDAYSQLDTSAVQAAAQNPDAPVIAVPGDCKGGQPNAALVFTNLAQLRSVTRSGPAYDTARAAFLGGASKVILVRAGTPTQSTEALAGATGTPVTLKSIDYGAWTAVIKRTIATNNLVTIVGTDPNGNTFTEIYAVGTGATAQQVVDAINGKTPGFNKSQWVTASVTTGTMPLTTSAQAALSTAGTDDGTIDAGDWTNALKVLETQDVDLISPATGDATIHAQVLAHCVTMSSPAGRHERAIVTGGVLGENVATVSARMTTLNSARDQLVYPGIYLLNDAGVPQLYDPYVAGGYVAGMHAALPDVATSLVGANLGSAVVDVEVPLSTIPQGDLDQLLAANVTPIARDPEGGFHIVDSLSGYRADLSLRDFHKIRTADYTARTLRNELAAEFKGQKVTAAFADAVKQKANLILDRLVVRTILRGHNPADAIVDPVNDTITHVSAPIVIPGVNKFLFLTIALQPASALTTTS